MESPATLTEQQLWLRFQAGSEPAFQQIHQRHIRHLLNYGLRLNGSLSAVEDCIQDVFVELWLYRERLTQPSSVRFYLLKALRNRLKVQYRRDQPFVSGWDNDPDSQLPGGQPFDTEPSIEQQLVALDIDAEQRQHIQRAMNALSARQREILYLRYFNDLSYEEICGVMNINYQTARSQVYQSLKLLRTILTDSRLPFEVAVVFFFS